jgi:iron(III) transport system substrate-binding protein
LDHGRRDFGCAVGALAACSLARPARARTPAPARRQGKVVVYSSTEPFAAAPLNRDFRVLHPAIEVEYHHLNSLELYHRFLKESAAGEPGADVLWSSAMDLQVKLVNDGHASVHASTEADRLPPWAIWKHEAFGTTYEPIGVAYSRRHLKDAELPRTHAELARWLVANRARARGRVATYDPEGAGLGWLVASEDARTSEAFWDIARALGQAEVRLHTSTAEMLEEVASGRLLLAYNLLGSYARPVTRRDPAVGLLLLSDYTLVVARVAFIARRARHPDAARLWLEHLLSQRGQQVCADQGGLFSVRGDVNGPGTAAALQRELGASARPIAIGPGLLVHLDQSRRGSFLHRWRQALAPPR